MTINRESPAHSVWGAGKKGARGIEAVGRHYRHIAGQSLQHHRGQALIIRRQRKETGL